MPEELYLTIPCKPGKPSDLRGPKYIFIGYDQNGYSQCEYECPHCGQRNPRRAPLETHMGLDPAKPASCRILKAQDEARRSGSQKQLEELREELKHGNQQQATSGTSGAVGRSGVPTEGDTEKRPDVHPGRSGSLFT